MGNLTITDIITAIVALYGALLSSAIFINNLSAKRKRIRIKLSGGFLTGMPQLSEYMLILNISNPGSKSVTVNTPYIKLPDGKQIILFDIQSNYNFPHTLEEGKSVHAWIEFESLKQELIRNNYSGKVNLLCYLQDQTDKTFRSKKPIKIDLSGK